MRFRLLLTICCMAFFLKASAQASGGQITRKKPDVSKPRRRNNSSTDNVSSNSEQMKPFVSMPTSRKADSIHPLYISSLSKYSVVTSSFHTIDKARNECQSLRDKGYLSNIYFDNQMQMYHVLIFSSTNYEQKAMQNLNRAKEICQEAWILCVEKGRTYKYGSSGNDISSIPIQTRPVSSSQRMGTSSSIEPIFLTSLSKYNIVAKTWSTFANAQEECQSMRNNGFHSNIYFESSKTYRVLIYSGTDNEQEAILLRNKAREKYPAAWIMCVENGRTYKYKK